MAKILCLSDIHFNYLEKSDSYGETINPDLEKSFESDKFQVLLEALECIGPIDLLILCGDYILGKNSDEVKTESFNIFLSFLKKIEASEKLFNSNVKSINDRIIIIPGNHDVARGCEDGLSDFKQKTARYLSPFYRGDRKQKHAPVFIFDDLKLIVACQSTVNNSATENTLMSKLLDEIKDETLFETVKKMVEDEMILDIPSITETDKAEFIKTNIELLNKSEYSDYSKVMATHHPLMDGIETGNTIKKFNSTIGGYSFMKTAMSYGYSLFIHGHLHEKSCVKITDYNMDAPIPVLQIGLPSCKLENDKYVGVLINTEVSPNSELMFSGNYLQYRNISRSLKQVKMLESSSVQNEKYLGSKILVDYEIRKILEEEKIVLDGDFGNIQAASYDCTLGYKYKRNKDAACVDWSSIAVDELTPDNDGPSSIEIKPNETVLIFTFEKFKIPNDMILHASPISSWARKGLRVDLSYFVDPGFEGNFCFPVKNESNKTLKINSREPIMSIEFVQLSNSCEQNWAQRNSDKLLARKNFES